MNTNPVRGQPLATRVEEVWAEIPVQLISPELRKRAVQFSKRMDNLARLNNQTQEAYVDEADLRVLLKESFSLEAANGVVSMLKNLPNSRLVSHGESGVEKHAKLTKIAWLDLVNRVEGPKSVVDMRWKNLGLTASSTPENFRISVQRLYPEIPGSVLELGPDKFYDLLHGAIESLPSTRVQPTKSSTGVPPAISTSFNLGSIWDCLVNNLGWWAVVWIIAGIVAWLWFAAGCTVFGIAPPAAIACWAAAIAVGIAILGVGTFVVVYNCLKGEGLV
jgi:hypothetical protein